MERRFTLADLHLRSCEAMLLGPLRQPANEERLTASVFTSDRLEKGAPRPHPREVLVERRLESAQADSKQVQPGLRHCSATKGGQDVVATLRGDQMPNWVRRRSRSRRISPLSRSRERTT